jgi:GNAT superfamily N-acetyltransferase
MEIGDEALNAADRNFIETWRAVLALAPRPRVVESETVLMMSSGESVSLFNPAFMLRHPDDPAEAVDGIVGYYGELGLPFALFFRDEICPALAETCSAAGLVEHWRPPLMVLDPIPPEPSEPPPPKVTFSPLDGSNVADYLLVLGKGFGMPEDLVERMFRRALREIPGFSGFLAWFGGEPVAISGLSMTERTAGIYNIATHPDRRNQGYGAAVTWWAVMAGRQRGAVRSILQASEAGEPIYRRMGFTTPTRYRQFEGKAPA